MKKKLKQGILWLAFGFIILFLFRLGYGYLYPSGSVFSPTIPSFGLSSAFEFSRKNYASTKFKSDLKSDGITATVVDQKYEKIASMDSRSQNFDSDEKKLRNLITNYNALIQFEQNFGLKGKRLWNVAIGVFPEKFDEIVAEVKKIGKLVSLRIDKADKTNEYKELKAKRISLEKTRDALLALKNQGGRIDEWINLENRILEIEQEIQSTGVRLGEYDQENEFCTVKISLQEITNTSVSIPLLTRVKVALEWTIKYYLAAMVTLFFGILFVLMTVVVLEKLKWIPITVKSWDHS